MVNDDFEKFERYRELTEALVKERTHAKQRVTDERQYFDKACRRLRDVERAQQVLQELAQSTQQHAHDQIAKVVTRCLRAVFPNPYKFEIIWERKRGRTEARLQFTRDGLTLDPLDSTGGGVIDVASFALRVARLLLVRPARRRLLVMDEPFKCADAPSRPRIQHMLETLSEELDMQFVMVTHSDELQCGKIIEIGD